MSPWLSDLYLRAQSDARLVALCADGHERAFAAIVERYRAELHGHASRLTGAAGAEDLVQQTMLSAFAALAAGTEVQHLRGWLHSILRHAALRTRAEPGLPLDELAACGEPLEHLVERRALARTVLAAVEALPARQRQALLGASVQGLSRAELAAALGVSEGAVRQLVHRARAALRAAISVLSPYPLARWAAGAVRPGGAAPALAGTGAASSAGLLAKAGALAAAGALATGVAVGLRPTSPAGHRSRPEVSSHHRAPDGAAILIARAPSRASSAVRFVTERALPAAGAARPAPPRPVASVAPARPARSNQPVRAVAVTGSGDGRARGTGGEAGGSSGRTGGAPGDGAGASSGGTGGEPGDAAGGSSGPAGGEPGDGTSGGSGAPGGSAPSSVSTDGETGPVDPSTGPTGSGSSAGTTGADGGGDSTTAAGAGPDSGGARDLSAGTGSSLSQDH